MSCMPLWKKNDLAVRFYTQILVIPLKYSQLKAEFSSRATTDVKSNLKTNIFHLFKFCYGESASSNFFCDVFSSVHSP